MAATYDVFISYRQSTDAGHAAALRSALEAAGVSVLFDVAALGDAGQPAGPVASIARSRLVLAIVSHESAYEISRLDAGSPADAQLVELRGALELHARGLVPRGVVPVYVQNVGAGFVRGADGRLALCQMPDFPPLAAAPDVEVAAVEAAVAAQLAAAGLGALQCASRTAAGALAAIRSDPGVDIFGDAPACYAVAADDVAILLRAAL